MDVVFVCVAALTILDHLDVVDEETLGWWLAERQLPCGGLNGRPEKLEDVRVFLHSDWCGSLSLFVTGMQVCYSFWVLSALSILNKLHYINDSKLIEFILSAQVRSSLPPLSFPCTKPFLRVNNFRIQTAAASPIDRETMSMSFIPASELQDFRCLGIQD